MSTDKTTQEAISDAAELNEGQLDQVTGGLITASEPPEPSRTVMGEPPDPNRLFTTRTH